MAIDEIRVEFNSQGIDPLRTKRASKAYLPLITTCTGTAALKIVQSTDLLSAAWWELLQRYRACGVKMKNTLMGEFNSLKMGLGEDPEKFPMRMGCVARELRRGAAASWGSHR